MNLLKKWLFLGLRQEMYKMSMEHIVIPDSREATADHWGHDKKKSQLKEVPTGQR